MVNFEGKQKTHFLSFDVEDWFQVRNLQSAVKFSEWESYPSRVQENTYKILKILKDHNTKATFFVLGWIAERYPALVETIVQEGHEVASHGYAHSLVYEQTPDAFEKDLKKSLLVLRRVAGERARGYRAPSFSITSNTTWALDILRRNGIKYDSSIFPIYHPEYGVPGAQRTPYFIRGILEVPPATVRFLGVNLPVGGGGYFRMLPYCVTRMAVNKLTRMGTRGTFYLHPWELDPHQPRVRVPFLKAIRHYTNLNTTAEKLKKLLSDYNFYPIGEGLRLIQSGLNA